MYKYCRMKKFFSGRNQLRVIVSSITGTTLMTLYSYAISWLQHKNFKEPELLGKMSRRLLPWIDRKESRITGWGMHYLVGLLFAEAYAPFWPEQQQHANIKTGLVLGGISGIAAILIWRFTLDAHPFPPLVDFVPFAGQLFIAHVRFGLVAAVGYALSGPNVV
jgi:hypothetical protein